MRATVPCSTTQVFEADTSGDYESGRSNALVIALRFRNDLVPTLGPTCSDPWAGH